MIGTDNSYFKKLSTSTQYLYDNYIYTQTASRLIKPTKTGIYIIKDCILYLVGLFSIICDKDAGFYLGLRDYKSDSQYLDGGIEQYISSTGIGQTRYYIHRLGTGAVGYTLRPIGFTPDTGIIYCHLGPFQIAVIALKKL